jgi:sugar lactone lactonase YvrE
VRLAPLLPGSPTIVYNLAATAARLGHVEEALSRLTQLADAGLAYDLAADDDFASLADRPAFRAVSERLNANRHALGKSSRGWPLATSDSLPEALAWDARTRRLFVSSVRHCEIQVVDDPARPRPGIPMAVRRFARLPASVFALGIDAERRRLWATIATVPQADRCGEGRPAAERTALVALDLQTGRLLQRVDAGVPPGVLGDMLVAEDGTVFVTESVHGAVLRLRPGARALERIDVKGEFESPQTPALSADGHTLFVPDYARGMATLELGACPCAAHWPANGAGVFTSGIDGLVRDGRTLVAVQNGTSPPRLVRFRDDLSRQQVLESGTPGLGEPTHGVVVGRALWFIADVGWDRFEESGRRKPGVRAAHSELRSIDLGAGLP